ncbi:Cupin domain protein [Catalinimonas alkaloidigena]|uniref:Cupin domain protein n=2 Tax=Catalinimonas alkaloidigena TaxID=1075417 RepID=A0A1G9UDS5_9BACT|nr:Cupin domain protein [Catalinimonas alkaloidigena]
MVWLGLVLLPFGAQAQSHSDANDAVFPRGERLESPHFTGAAWVYTLAPADSAFDIPVAHVTFAPGARTDWHRHLGGQVLLATGGTGYYQEQGKPLRILRKGDAVKCPPHVPHWHGAAPEAEFTQVAITPNTPEGRTLWMQKVTDEEYHQPPQEK